MAIVFLILPATFWGNEKISASCLTSVKSNYCPCSSSDKNNSSESFAVDEDEIFALVNDERQKSNLDVLAWDNQLSDIARDYSRQMAEENFFDHLDPQGADVVVRAKNARLKHWSKIGENLFSVVNSRSFDALAVRNWMKSPTHRQNILDADFNSSGIGIAKSGSGEIFITQVFIKR